MRELGRHQYACARGCIWFDWLTGVQDAYEPWEPELFMRYDKLPDDILWVKSGERTAHTCHL